MQHGGSEASDNKCHVGSRWGGNVPQSADRLTECMKLFVREMGRCVGLVRLVIEVRVDLGLQFLTFCLMRMAIMG